METKKDKSRLERLLPKVVQIEKELPAKSPCK